MVLVLVRFRKRGEGLGGGGGCWPLDSVAMSATTLNQPNNTEHICFTIAQAFFSLYFPCLIVKVPDGAESRLRWKKRKEKCQTWKVRRRTPISKTISRWRQWHQASCFKELALLFENAAEETCCNQGDLMCVWLRRSAERWRLICSFMRKSLLLTTRRRSHLLFPSSSFASLMVLLMPVSLHPLCRPLLQRRSDCGALPPLRRRSAAAVHPVKSRWWRHPGWQLNSLKKSNTKAVRWDKRNPPWSPHLLYFPPIITLFNRFCLFCTLSFSL